MLQISHKLQQIKRPITYCTTLPSSIQENLQTNKSTAVTAISSNRSTTIATYGKSKYFWVIHLTQY